MDKNLEHALGHLAHEGLKQAGLGCMVSFVALFACVAALSTVVIALFA